MASGCIVLASDDEPVREVIRPGVHGLLVTPDDVSQWVRLARQVLDDPAGHAALGGSARSTVLDRFERGVTLPRLAERLQGLTGLGA
jgi:glycosyltransferase involved in cell wall biosynthesis